MAKARRAETNHGSRLNRREFLQRSLVASAAAGFARVGYATVAAAERPASAMTAKPSWVDRPMRWAQLTLVEDDPPKLDIGFWLDYFRRTKSDAV